MTTEDTSGPSAPTESASKQESTQESLSSQRVFKKTSPNNKLTIYLSSRDLVVSAGRIDRLQGVLLVDPEFVQDRKVYGQVTLTFRYGREDEEVMGLKFCNEAIMCLAQLYPPHPAAQPPEGNTPLQEALLKRLGSNAYPFSMEITPLAPPSVQLVPAKEYNGAPIGTSYDIRAYVGNIRRNMGLSGLPIFGYASFANNYSLLKREIDVLHTGSLMVDDRADEKLHRRTTVRMGIRVVQRAFAPPSPDTYNLAGMKSVDAKVRDKTKQQRKALFGSKSAPPLEIKFPEKEREISKSQEISSKDSMSDVRGERKTNEKNSHESSSEIKETSQGIEMKLIRRGSKEKEDKNGVTSASDEKLSRQGSRSDRERPARSGVTTRVSFKAHLTNGTQSSCEPQSEHKAAAAAAAAEGDEGKDAQPQVDVTSDDKATDEAEESPQSRDAQHEHRICEQYRSLCGGKRPSLAAYLQGVPPPRASVEKPFLLSDGKIHLAASLDKAIYSHGEEMHVSVQVHNMSNKTVRRIKVFIVQHVDVCMFSNGKFKNVVAMISTKDDCPITSGGILDKTFTLLPVKSSTKNWIALEDSYTKAGTSLASTVTSTENNPEERNVFAIYVSYYVKVKLVVSVLGGEVSLKLPFTLMHTCSDFDHTESLARVKRPNVQLELRSAAEEPVKQEKDGT